MRHSRPPILTLLAIAALAVACSSAPGSSSGEESGQGAGASQEAASTDGSGSGGDGSGGGTNGSITYEITGDYEVSGELPFLAQGISSWIESEGGWLANFANSSGEGATIIMNTATRGQILTYGDGTILVPTASDPNTGYDCTFILTKNDSSGLTGSMECTGIPASNATTGAMVTVDIKARWDAHP